MIASSPIVKVIELNCTVEHAFDAFTSRIDLWWPPSHRPSGAIRMCLEPIVGGSFYAERADGSRVELGEVFAVEAPSRLSYWWNPGRGVGPTSVEVSFEAAADRTRVKVVHSEGASDLGAQWPERAKIFDAAWDNVLEAIAQFVA